MTYLKYKLKRKVNIVNRIICVLLTLLMTIGLFSINLNVSAEAEIEKAPATNLAESSEENINNETSECTEVSSSEETTPLIKTEPSTDAPTTTAPTSAETSVIKDKHKIPLKNKLSTGASISGTCGSDLRWSFDNNTLTLSGTGGMYTYKNSAAFPWYKKINLSQIYKVVIEEGVTSISNNTFYNFTKLESVSLPNSLNNIGGKNTFYNCTSLSKLYIQDLSVWCTKEYRSFDMNPLNYAHNLYVNNELVTELTIPNDVECIYPYAFYGCTSISSVSIPDNVTSIGVSAFSDCNNLESVVIAESVTQIGNFAFNSCSNLETINIPNGVTSIGDGTFSGCSNLETLTIPNTVKTIGGSAFSSCSSLRNFNIPSGVTSIGDGAFSLCYAIEAITIPEKVKTIGSGAFVGCKRLKEITFGDSICKIGTNAFENCSLLRKVNISDITVWCNISFGNNEANPLYYAKNLYLNDEPVTSISFPNSISNIKPFLFSGCITLTDINIPDSVTTIGESAFNGCTSISSVSIPDNVTSIGVSAFQNCKSLSEVVISNNSNLSTIGNYAFKNTKLTQLPSYPQNCNVGQDAFKVEDINWEYNKATKTLTINGTGDITRGDWFYLYGTSLKTVVINEGVRSIGDSAFSDCEELESIIIPDTVTSIGKSAFYKCVALKSINLPDSVTTIGRSAFSWCKSLATILISPSVKTIEYGAFYYCNNLKSVTINDIAAWCNISFGNNEANPLYYASELYLDNTLLTSLVIPETVTSIKAYAFYNYEKLTDVIINDSSNLSSIDNYSFANCLGLLHKPKNISPDCSISSTAFEGCGFGEGTVGYNLNWKIENGVLTISGDGYMKDFNSYLSVPWYKYMNSITDIVIEDGVTAIASHSFQGCKLHSIYIGENAVFREDVFVECDVSSLNSIVINPNNNSFENSEQYKAIISTNNNELVLGCNETVLPDTITSIGSSAFYKCVALKSINLPEGVTSIGDKAFSGCTNLENVSFSSDLKSIGYSAFNDCKSLKDISLPDGLVSIREKAFENCSGLKNIYIPKNVESISDSFNACKNIESIKVDSDNDKYDSRDNCNAIIDSLNNELIVGCSKTVIPNTVKTIGGCAFSNCENLEKIVLPNGITRIGNYAFDNCNNLISIELGNNIELIGYCAFRNCAISNIDLPNTLTTIGWSAFESCSKLQSVKIPNSVVDMGQAFKDCSGLEEIVIGDGVTSISSYSFENCKKLKKVTLNNKIESIGYRAFSNCGSLTNINLPDSINSIEEEAFYNCSSLLSVIISENVTSINQGTFRGCSSLLSAIVGNGVKSIGNNAFSGCSSLNVVVSDNVSDIGENAFNNCNMVICPITSYSYDLLTSYDFYRFRSDSTTPVGIVTAKYQLNQILKAKNKNSNKQSSFIRKKAKLNTGSSEDNISNDIVCDSFIERIIQEDLSNVQCYVVDDLKVDETLTFNSNLNVTLHLNEFETDNDGNIKVDSNGNVVDGKAHTITGSNKEVLFDVPGTLTIKTTKEANGGILNDKGAIFNVLNGGKLIIEDGTYSEDVSKYIPANKVISKTDKKYTVINPSIKDLILENDGREVIMPNNQAKFSRNEFVGVQIRAASEREYINEANNSVHTVELSEAMRFVSVVKTDVLRGAEDYGYILVKGRNYESMKDRKEKICYGSEGCAKVSLKDTKNTLANPEYSSNNLNEGKYKYLTAAVHHIDDESTSVGARFYIKRTDGTFVYSDYICVSTMQKLKSMVA